MLGLRQPVPARLSGVCALPTPEHPARYWVIGAILARMINDAKRSSCDHRKPLNIGASGSSAWKLPGPNNADTHRGNLILMDDGLLAPIDLRVQPLSGSLFDTVTQLCSTH